jgi:hypothetical protein
MLEKKLAQCSSRAQQAHRHVSFGDAELASRLFERHASHIDVVEDVAIRGTQRPKERETARASGVAFERYEPACNDEPYVSGGRARGVRSTPREDATNPRLHARQVLKRGAPLHGPRRPDLKDVFGIDVLGHARANERNELAPTACQGRDHRTSGVTWVSRRSSHRSQDTCRGCTRKRCHSSTYLGTSSPRRRSPWTRSRGTSRWT